MNKTHGEKKTEKAEPASTTVESAAPEASEEPAGGKAAAEPAENAAEQPAEPAVEADEAPEPVVEELAEPSGSDIDLVPEDEDVDSEDSLTFSNGVIEKIVAIAMRDVPGVVGMKGSWFNRVQDAFGASDSTKGVSVEVTPESAVRVNISVLIEYGAYAPQVFEDVKRAVVKHVSGMTGLEVAGVNLRIEDVLTPEEVEQRAHRPRKDEEEEE